MSNKNKYVYENRKLRNRQVNKHWVKLAGPTIVILAIILTTVAAAYAGDYGVLSGGLELAPGVSRPTNVTILPTELEIDEGGDPQSYSISLNIPPSDPVTMTLTISPTNAPLSADVESLRFEPENWPEVKTVTLTADNNNVVEVKSSVEISHTVESVDVNYHEIPIDSVTVTIIEDDIAGIRVPQPWPTIEEGGTGSYFVQLTSRPTHAVTVSFTSTAEESVAAPDPITIQRNDWSKPREVVLTVSDDKYADGSRSEQIVHAVDSVDPNYASANAGLVIENVTVEIADNDQAGFEFDQPQLVITEGDAPKEYSVRLKSRPRHPVTVELSATPDNQVTLNPTELSFDDASWAVDDWRPIQIVADRDLIREESPLTALAKHEAISQDPSYGGEVSALTVIIYDADGPGIVADPSLVSVTEGGEVATIQVRLAAEPSTDVEIYVSAENDDVAVLPNVLRFTALDWNKQQPVTIEAVDDDDAEEDEETGIVRLDANSQDEGYNVEQTEVEVIIHDNDLARVGIEPTVLRAFQGEEVQYEVWLTSRPVHPVTVSIDPDDSIMELITIEPTNLELEFMVDDLLWQDHKTVTLTIDYPFSSDSTAVTSVIGHSSTSDDPKYVLNDLQDVTLATYANYMPVVRKPTEWEKVGDLSDEMRSVLACDEGTTIYAGTRAKGILVWDSSEWKPLHEGAIKGSVWAISLSNQEACDSLYVGAYEGSLWYLHNSEIVPIIKEEPLTELTSVVVRGNEIFIGDDNGIMRSVIPNDPTNADLYDFRQTNVNKPVMSLTIQPGSKCIYAALWGDGAWANCDPDNGQLWDRAVPEPEDRFALEVIGLDGPQSQPEYLLKGTYYGLYDWNSTNEWEKTKAPGNLTWALTTQNGSINFAGQAEGGVLVQKVDGFWDQYGIKQKLANITVRDLMIEGNVLYAATENGVWHIRISD